MSRNDPQTPILETGTRNFPPMVDSKRRTSRRLLWRILLVPLTLIFITVTTRYLMTPSESNLVVSKPDSLSWHERFTKDHSWQPHQLELRQVSVSIASNTISTTSASASTTMITDMPIPTIPSSPPALPTPFPQPFESDLSKNFSTTTCYNFFANMTADLAFRSCRSLSFLMDSSSSFLNAQTNLTLMNSIIWGTCNTDTSEEQCVDNMGRFSDQLETECAQDLQDQNQMAVSARRDLRAYTIMRETGCLTDPASNTYCYVQDAKSSDLYFYNLPLGIAIPNNTTPLCSACTRSLMSFYASALSNSTEADMLTGLKQTYGSAAKLAVDQCGTGFADTTVASAAQRLPLGRSWWTGVAMLLLGAMFEVLS